MKSTTPYDIKVTPVTAGVLGKGEYGAVMTLGQALAHPSLAGVADADKYGYFSPIDAQGRALVGEVTMIGGVAYWTGDGATPSLQVLSPDAQISFGQIMVMRRDAAQEVTLAANAATGFSDFSSAISLIGNHIQPTVTGAGTRYADSNMGMVMALFQVRLDGGTVRWTFEPTARGADGKYTPAAKVPQFKEGIKPGTDAYVLCTNFLDRITEETDVKAPHFHFVPKAAVERVQALQAAGKDISNPEHLKQINAALAELVQQGMPVGGHITVLGQGQITGSIHYQPEQSCVMIGVDQKDRVIPLTDNRSGVVTELATKMPRLHAVTPTLAKTEDPLWALLSERREGEKPSGEKLYTFISALADKLKPATTLYRYGCRNTAIIQLMDKGKQFLAALPEVIERSDAEPGLQDSLLGMVSGISTAVAGVETTVAAAPFTLAGGVKRDGFEMSIISLANREPPTKQLQVSEAIRVRQLRECVDGMLGNAAHSGARVGTTYMILQSKVPAQALETLLALLDPPAISQSRRH